MQGRLDGLEAQLAAAERAAASSEAQRRAMADEKNRFQKQAKVGKEGEQIYHYHYHACMTFLVHKMLKVWIIRMHPHVSKDVSEEIGLPQFFSLEF